jgi:hypothetical protein
MCPSAVYGTISSSIAFQIRWGSASHRAGSPIRARSHRAIRRYYVGEIFEVAFLETIVRDQRNGNPGALILSANDLDDYVHVHITVRARLDLVDLRDGNAVALGVPTNAVRASSHGLGQRASLAVYQRAERLDGIWYPSRLNGDENLAVYDRAVSKLSAGPRRKLGTCSELAPILGTYRAALV